MEEGWTGIRAASKVPPARAGFLFCFLDPVIRKNLHTLSSPHLDHVHSTQSQRYVEYHGSAGFAFEAGVLMLLYFVDAAENTWHIVVTHVDLLFRSVGTGVSWRVAWRSIILFEPSFNHPRRWSINAQPDSVVDGAGGTHDSVGPFDEQDGLLPRAVVDLFERIRVYMLLSGEGDDESSQTSSFQVKTEL